MCCHSVCACCPSNCATHRWTVMKDRRWTALTLMAWLKQLMAAWRCSLKCGKCSCDNESLAAANDLADVVRALASDTLLVSVCSHLQNMTSHWTKFTLCWWPTCWDATKPYILIIFTCNVVESTLSTQHTSKLPES